MKVVSEVKKNIFGQYQWYTLFKSEDYFEAEKFFHEYKTSNRLELCDNVQAEVLAVKLANN